MAKKLVNCDTPYCDNTFFINTAKRRKRKHRFCTSCNIEHSYHVLAIQVYHQKSMKDVILDARVFNTAVGMSDYVGVSFVTMYHWIKKYFNMTFQQFKREYICRSPKCYILNLDRSPYSRKDYVLKKIKDRGYCACINDLEKDYVMTNAPASVVSSVFAGSPDIRKMTDGTFHIIPTPIYFKHSITPVYFKYDISPIYFDLI